jgi:hypothetical protein
MNRRRMDDTLSASLERFRFRPNSAMRFIDLVVGGFATRELELKLDVPEEFHGEEMQILVFASERGRWVELPSAVEIQGSKLCLCIPMEELKRHPTSVVHLAVALVPQSYMASLS